MSPHDANALRTLPYSSLLTADHSVKGEDMPRLRLPEPNSCLYTFHITAANFSS